MGQECNVAMCLGKNVETFHGKYAKMFQSNNVEMSQDSNAEMFQSKNVGRFRNKNAEACLVKLAVQYQNKNAQMFLGKNANKNARTYFGAKFVIKIVDSQFFEIIFILFLHNIFSL